MQRNGGKLSPKSPSILNAIKNKIVSRVFAVVKNENPYVDNYAKLPKIYYAQFLIDIGLPGKTTIAIDDSKFKAVTASLKRLQQEE